MINDQTADENLWEAIQEGHTKAFSLLYDRYWYRVYTTAFHHLKDQETCIEVVHDIFLNLWQKRAQLQIQSFPAYLTTAARYHVYRKAHQQQQQRVTYTDTLELLSQSEERNTAVDKLREAELEVILMAALAGLPKRCREIFLMSRKEQLTNEEIAVRLGISKRTVENQLTYALAILRDKLKDLIVLVLLYQQMK